MNFYLLYCIEIILFYDLKKNWIQNKFILLYLLLFVVHVAFFCACFVHMFRTVILLFIFRIVILLVFDRFTVTSCPLFPFSPQASTKKNSVKKNPTPNKTHNAQKGQTTAYPDLTRRYITCDAPQKKLLTVRNFAVLFWLGLRSGERASVLPPRLSHPN